MRSKSNILDNLGEKFDLFGSQSSELDFCWQSAVVSPGCWHLMVNRPCIDMQCAEPVAAASTLDMERPLCACSSHVGSRSASEQSLNEQVLVSPTLHPLTEMAAERHLKCHPH